MSTVEGQVEQGTVEPQTPAEQVATVVTNTEAGISEVKAGEAATVAETAKVLPTVDTDAIAAGLAAIGHPVADVWDDVVSFAKAAEGDFHTAAKAGLSLIEHSAVGVYDKVVALLKHKG